MGVIKSPCGWFKSFRTCHLRDQWVSLIIENQGERKRTKRIVRVMCADFNSGFAAVVAATLVYQRAVAKEVS